MAKTKKDLINSIGDNHMMKLFLKNMKPVQPTGFAVFVDGVQMKPVGGNVSTYPSINAALQAIERNSPSYGTLSEKLFKQEFGFTWKEDKKRYMETLYENPEAPYNHVYKPGMREAMDVISSAASAALMNYVKKWIKEGKIVIKEI